MKYYNTFTILFLGESGKIKIVDNKTHKSIMIDREENSSITESSIKVLEQKGIKIMGSTVNNTYNPILIASNLKPLI